VRGEGARTRELVRLEVVRVLEPVALRRSSTSATGTSCKATRCHAPFMMLAAPSHGHSDPSSNCERGTSHTLRLSPTLRSHSSKGNCRCEPTLSLHSKKDGERMISNCRITCLSNVIAVSELAVGAIDV